MRKQWKAIHCHKTTLQDFHLPLKLIVSPGTHDVMKSSLAADRHQAQQLFQLHNQTQAGLLWYRRFFLPSM